MATSDRPNSNHASNTGEARPHNTTTSRLNLCNTVIGITGLAAASCFGIITIVQSNTANKEAKRSNDIAFQSLLLSGLSTCSQLSDNPIIANFTLCQTLGSFDFYTLWNTAKLSGVAAPRGVPCYLTEKESRMFCGAMFNRYPASKYFDVGLNSPLGFMLYALVFAAAGFGSWELPRFKLRKEPFELVKRGNIFLVLVVLLLISTKGSNSINN